MFERVGAKKTEKGVAVFNVCTHKHRHGGEKVNGITVCTHKYKHRHPPAPCEQGFLPGNIACLSG
jgi:hypothetical protein